MCVAMACLVIMAVPVVMGVVAVMIMLVGVVVVVCVLRCFLGLATSAEECVGYDGMMLLLLLICYKVLINRLHHRILYF